MTKPVNAWLGQLQLRVDLCRRHGFTGDGKGLENQQQTLIGLNSVHSWTSRAHWVSVHLVLHFHHWRQLGNTGWGFTDVLPYFRIAESWEGGANDLRSGDGPVNVSYTLFTHPIIDAWLDAAVTVGYPRNDDEVCQWWQKVGGALRYAANLTELMALTASLGAAFFKTRPELESPDIQFHIQPFSKGSLIADTHPFSAFTGSVCQLRPESISELRLRSGDMRDYPKIYENYLSTRTDCDTIVEGMRIARRINNYEPLKSLVTSEHVPGDEVGDDYDELLDWTRSNATTIFHPAGTCEMGSDRRTVVDERLRVHGVAGLSVADCSIMPSIVSGNTNASAIMTGEKAAAMVLEDTIYV